MTASATGSAASGGPGTVLGGRYRLEDLLSETYGARFWRGTDVVLGRSVAIHAVASEDSRASSLLGAARLSATVSDPRLLRVLDCDSADGISWVVNEWGEGLSLDLILQRDVLPPARAAWLAREVAETIANAHSQGVSHGRLNPEAVLVTHAGAVKLIGFVIDAVLVAPGRAQGSAQGGPDPSQISIDGIDHRERDVVDLASILYSALVGRWPGLSGSQVPRAPRDARGPLRPRQVRAGVPRLLDTLCERVLRREAHEHMLPIETAQEIAAALDDYVGDPTVNAPGTLSAMYVEPSEPVRRHPVTGRPADPEATQAGTPDWGSTADGLGAGAGWSSTEEPVPPLPPYEEPPGRPLFASAEPRTPPPQPAQPTPPTTQAPAPAPAPPPPPGSEAWLFGEEQPYDPVPPERRPWSRSLLVAGAVVLLVIAMVVAFKLGLDNGPSNPAATGSDPGQNSGPTRRAEVVHPIAVSDFDPEATPSSENPEEVPLATDGKARTGWATMTYQGNSHLGNLKSGVGLLFDLGADKQVSSMRVTFTGAPTTFSVYASRADVSDPPTHVTGMRKVGGMVAQQSHATLRFDRPVKARFFVLWLTDLPPYQDGFRAQVDEVQLLS